MLAKGYCQIATLIKRSTIANVTARIACLACVLAATASQADTTNDLIMALVNKGVLTEEEGAPLLENQRLLKNQSIIQSKENAKSTVGITYADGMILQTVDQANVLAINGRVQFDARYYMGKDAQTADTFDIRRAYLTVRGKVDQHYDFNVTADFTQQNSALDQAYIGINWFNQAKLRLGQFDMPFGLEHLTSDLFLEFQERSFNDYLTPGKERGLMLHGAPTSVVYYGLAVSAGRGKNVNNQDSQVGDLDVIARISTNLAEVLGNQAAVYHIGVDYSNGDMSPNQARGSAQLTAGGFTAPTFSTEARGTAFFTPGKFSTAFTDNPVERTRYGLEAAYAIGPFKLQYELFKHTYSGVNSDSTAFDQDISAWYISAYYMLTGENLAATYQQNGTWGRIKPKHDFSPTDFKSSKLGALGFGLRYSALDASDFDVGNGPGEMTNGNSASRAKAWTAGLRWLLNSHTHLVANYVTTHFNQPLTIKNSIGTKVGGTQHENAFSVRAQMDF